MNKNNETKGWQSKCCEAPVTTEGDTTKYYVCSVCHLACDVTTPSLSEEEEWEKGFDATFMVIENHVPVFSEIYKKGDISEIKDFIRTILSQTRANERERMVAIGEELEAPLENEYDLESFHEGYFTAITAYQQKIKSLNS